MKIDMQHIIYKTTNLLNNKIYIGYHKTKDHTTFDNYYGSGIKLKQAIMKYGESSFKRETLFVFDNKQDAMLKEREIVDINFIKSRSNYNLCIGGFGGNLMVLKTYDQKILIRLKANETRKKNGKIFSKQTLLKMSQSAKIRIKEKPHTLPKNKGRKHFGKGLHNMRIAARKKAGLYHAITDGFKKKIILKSLPIPCGWHVGGIPTFLGHKQTLEAKSKIANHENIKGIVCYTDGIRNIKLKPFEDIPKGFYKGMTQKHNDVIWITNGNESKRQEVSKEIPEGWKMGRVFKQKEVKQNDDMVTLEKLKKMSQLKDFDNLKPISNVTVTKIKHDTPQELYCLAVPGKAFWIKSNDQISVTGNTMHAEGMIKVFREYVKENKEEVWNDVTKKNIYDIAREMVALEDKFLDLAFDMIEVERLTKDEVKQYIRYIADSRLISMGMKPIFKVKNNPLPWVEAMLGASHTNFFEQRVTDYAKGALTGSWEDVWGAVKK